MMWRAMRDMVWSSACVVGRYATFLQGLMPLFGRWLVFAICVPIAVRCWRSLRRKDWYMVGVALFWLVVFCVLFVLMVAVMWEVLRYKWGL